MNNQVAAPCCGSCKYFYYDQEANSDLCHNKKATLMYKMSISHRLCAGGYYSPRNPILLTCLSEVKELEEKAYREGVDDCIKELANLPINQVQIDNMTYEYMKALEDKDE